MKIVCIYHFAAHYRRTIFFKMEKDLGCHFIFGNPMDAEQKSIKFLSPEEFRLFDFSPRNRIFIHLPWYWQHGIWKVLFHGYTHLIVLGDPFCVSSWLLAIALFFCPGTKLYFWTHGWYGRESCLKKIIKKLFFKMADGIFLYGNYAKKLMLRDGFDEKKLFVIHNSLDYEKQSELFETLTPRNIFEEHFHNLAPTLLFVGRLTQVKRLDMLLNAVKSLEDKGLETNLILIGDGPVKPELEKLAQQYGITDRVWFYGPCYEEKELAPLIYNATVCVAPGEVGLTAIHAMSYGCPVVTHDDFAHQMPEFEAIIPGKTGAFFQYGSMENLTDVLLRDLPCWERDRNVFREQCRKEITENWSPEFQIRQFRNGLEVRL